MQVFVARQPIFDRRSRVMAYELLFRAGDTAAFDADDVDEATRRVIFDSFLVIGLDKITGGKPAYINFTQNLLLSDLVAQLPKEQVVIEVLETVKPEPAIVAACIRLKQQGFSLALDDFVFAPGFRPLIELADIIKVDFLATTGPERQAVMEKVAAPHVRFLAEKVETHADFAEALSAGYSYFQGYFFSKPAVISGRDLPASKINQLRILRELSRPDLDFEKLRTIIEHDVALSFKLLKFINSVAFSLASRVQSVRQALVLLGTREIARWVSLLALRELGANKPAELIVESTIRAKFGELMAARAGLAHRRDEIFLLGMFSFIDALIDRPMAEIVTELPIAADVAAALLGEANQLGRLLQMMIAYERGEWPRFVEHAADLAIAKDEMPALYLEALRWADELEV